MSKAIFWTAAFGVALAVSGCGDQLDRVDYNMDRAANNFEVRRRVVMMNGITDKYILEIEGLCAIQEQTGQLEVTCQHAPGQFKRHFFGLSHNVTYFVEQIGTSYVNKFHYRVVFAPQVIIPDIDVQGDVTETPITDGR